MKTDYSWLEPYSDLLVGKEVLELGCGSGIDTRVLGGLAKRLVSSDLDPGINCAATTMIVDHSKPLPFNGGVFDTVVASLCLHYFKIEKTKEIITEIYRVLNRGGTLICRLNSSMDTNYGAVGYSEIEPGLFDVNGEQKRFFKKQEIIELWSQGFEISDIIHKSIDRYESPKFVYEFTATKT